MATETATKRYTHADVEALLASEPDSATPMTCNRLCQKRAGDLALLDSLQEFPVKNRAAIRAFLIGDLRTVTAALKSGHCPECQ